jgi:hypothetical protein
MSNTNEITLTHASRLVAKSLAQVSRDAAAGKYGPVRKTKAEVFVTVAGLSAHFGKQFTDADIEAAAAPKRTLSDEDFLRTYDPGVVSWFCAQRDGEWLFHLGHRLRLGPIQSCPPPSDLAVPSLDHQRFFSRHEVEELLAAALTQRDAGWRTWINSDLTTQAQNPNGPTPLAVKNIKL